MKTKIIITALLMIIISCQEKPRDFTVRIIEKKPDPEKVKTFEDEKIGVNLTQDQLDEIKSFRPFVQDIVWYIYVYPEKMKLNGFHWKGGRFSFWIANGYEYFRCEYPESELRDGEKKYLWKMYTDYRDKHHRIYEWNNTNLK